MKNNFFRYAFVIAFIVSALFITHQRAVAVDCDAIFSGNWCNPAIWDCGHVPEEGDNVFIVSPGLSITVNVDTDVSANVLRIEPTGELNAGDQTIRLCGTVPFDNSGTFNGDTSTVILSDADHTLICQGTATFNNLIMDTLTAPRTITIGDVGGHAEVITVNGYFISGSTAANRVSFVKEELTSNVANEVTSYYCASNGGITNINCIAGGPPAPSDLAATAVSQTQIDLSWTDNSTDETGFKIFRGGTLIVTTAADATTYSDAGLACGTTYNYEVKTTVMGADSSGVSDSATTDACSVPSPAPSSSGGGGASTPSDDYPVYRFYSPVLSKYLFTIDENEKEHLINNMAAAWTYEGIAYFAFHPSQYQGQQDTLQAVHRFYSPVLRTHLFTTDENEKEHLIVNVAHIWSYEGIAFYVPTGYQPGTMPVYRFYSPVLRVHLFTIDENEKEHLIQTAGNMWQFEGVAYYAYP